MKGWDASGETVRLAPEQERTVRALLTWHRHGVSVTLPRMGRGAGKTVIMRTVARLILENTEVEPPVVTKTGRVLTDAGIQELADEAERGYDPGGTETRG